MKRLNFLDTGILLEETREIPMHIGFVSLYTMPEGVDEQTFLSELADTLRDVEDFQYPFGVRLKTGRLGLAGASYWESDPSIDIDYHICRSALPHPGCYRELFNHVSRLHSTLLDRSRPLWEVHLIEGLENRQFAVYLKAHHAAMDGERFIHIARSMLSPNPEDRQADSPLSLATGERYRAALRREIPDPVSDKELRNVAEVLEASFDSSVNAYCALKRLSNSLQDKAGALALPFKGVPRTSINTPVGGARYFVGQSWPFARIRAIGKAFGGTFNDAVLAMCAGALRTYLQNHAELPEKSLKVLVPVSLRSEGDIDSSNKVATIRADLATNIKDPARRMAVIQASIRAGKEFYMDMSPTEAQVFSAVLMMPGVFLGQLGLASRLPAFNTVISNIPGIRQPMYWNGARLEACYPVSVLMEGVALNITLVTYDKSVDFGIIACRRSMPQAHRLVDYMEQALVELEEVAGLPAFKTKDKVKAKPKSVLREKSTTRSKSKKRSK